MSDHSASIVPKISEYPNRELKAKEIIDWLVSLDVIKPTLSDCVLGEPLGYAFSKGSAKISSYPPDLSMRVSGMAVITERTVFHTGENGIQEMICPKCKQNLAETGDWGDCIEEWYEGKNEITCPCCGTTTEIHNFSFCEDPNFSFAWGFSDLGFSFWGMSYFADEFVEAFRQKLGCEVDVVNTMI